MRRTAFAATLAALLFAAPAAHAGGALEVPLQKGIHLYPSVIDPTAVNVVMMHDSVENTADGYRMRIRRGKRWKTLNVSTVVRVGTTAEGLIGAHLTVTRTRLERLLQAGPVRFVMTRRSYNLQGEPTGKTRREILQFNHPAELSFTFEDPATMADGSEGVG